VVNAAGKFGPYGGGDTRLLPGRGQTGSDLVRSRIALRVRLKSVTPGDRLPDAGVLSEELGISEITVRRALEGMCQDGLLDRRRGRAGGTFVAAGWDAVVALMRGRHPDARRRRGGLAGRLPPAARVRTRGPQRRRGTGRAAAGTTGAGRRDGPDRRNGANARAGDALPGPLQGRPATGGWPSAVRCRTMATASSAPSRRPLCPSCRRTVWSDSCGSAGTVATLARPGLSGCPRQHRDLTTEPDHEAPARCRGE
jgi:hypothetical protein